MKDKAYSSGARLRFIGAMLIFGTIGLLRRGITLPSALLACLRGGIGGAALLIYGAIAKQPCPLAAGKKYAGRLFLTGLCLGLNWVLLFEAYAYTTVALATLSYYMAPVLVLVFSAVFLKERPGKTGLLCMAGAVLGMVLVSGALFGEIKGGKGLLLGLAAACFYAGVMLFGRTVREVPPLYATAAELLSAALVLLPYTLLRGEWSGIAFTAENMLLTLAAGLVHTGLCYVLYFGALPHMPAAEAALLSYIDPAAAVLLSRFVLREPLSEGAAWGGALILVCAFLSDRASHRPARYVTGQERALVEDAAFLSFYNGVPFIRHPFRHFTSGAACFCVFLNGNRGRDRRYHANANTVRHEYGHVLQARELGPFRYWRYIAVPSMRGYFSHVPYADYYNQPWERGADAYGGVMRTVHTEESLAEWEAYREKILPRRKRREDAERKQL